MLTVNPVNGKVETAGAHLESEREVRSLAGKCHDYS
jgi:hypothetical protein